jgi:exonuclease V
LSDAQEAARQWKETEEEVKESVEVGRSPLVRFRSYPKKPLSVSDLTAGSWCELQHFYTLTRLRGKKTRTEAMKRGTKLHQKLEREIYKTKRIHTIKKEDTFGLKIWNMIQGLRVLREEGFTREFEVWGMVDGNLVCGVIDQLGYKNPDQELEEDVLSSRESSQNITNSQPYEPSMPGESQVFVTDVKTRNTSSPPPQSQVRVAIIQLFLYHRFMSDMAAGRLDYMTVFERYALKPDEAFSDSFMAQIGEMHEEIFADADTESTSTLDDDNSSTTEAGEFVSAPSSPSQLSFTSSTPELTLKYRTLRTLLTLLQFELHLTFPRGASDLGNIVAVEYRYRGRDTPRPPPPNPNPDSTTTTTGVANPTLPTNLALNPDETDPFQPNARPPRKQEPEPGSVICTNTFFVEPETLDLFLSETMAWWKGEREPQGVPVEEAGFKCRSCEFLGDCEWRQSKDLEARKRSRGRGGLGGGSVAGSAAGVSVVGVGDVEDAGGTAAAPKRRGRPRKVVEKEEAEVDEDAEREIEIAEREAKREVKRGRGRPRKAEQVVDVDVEVEEVGIGEGGAGRDRAVKKGKGRPKNIILREEPRW